MVQTIIFLSIIAITFMVLFIVTYAKLRSLEDMIIQESFKLYEETIEMYKEK